MPQNAAGPAPYSLPLQRRGLLAGIGTTALLTGMGLDVATSRAVANATPPSAAFLAASRFVTGARLDDMRATGRAWSQLVALDGGFPQAVDRLHAAITRAGLASMAAFVASPLARDAALVATATTIVSAFYLGFTGTPVDHRAEDNTGFVTYVGALMWQPTLDATVIPTFARGGTDYWVRPPAGTPIPHGPTGQPDWQGSTASSHPRKA